MLGSLLFCDITVTPLLRGRHSVGYDSHFLQRHVRYSFASWSLFLWHMIVTPLRRDRHSMRRNCHFFAPRSLFHCVMIDNPCYIILSFLRSWSRLLCAMIVTPFDMIVTSCDVIATSLRHDQFFFASWSLFLRVMIVFIVISPNAWSKEIADDVIW